MGSVNNLDDAQKRIHELEAKCKQLIKQLANEEVSHDSTLRQRDYAESMADRLSTAIVSITNQQVGEHSSANCPWTNAAENAENYALTRQP